MWGLAGLSEPVVLRTKLGKCQNVKTREFLGIAYVRSVRRGELAGSSLPKENIVR